MQGAALTLEMAPCEQSILDKCVLALTAEEESLVASCSALWKEVDEAITTCRQLVTPDCACFSDIREKKEVFKTGCKDQGEQDIIEMCTALSYACLELPTEYIITLPHKRNQPVIQQ